MSRRYAFEHLISSSVQEVIDCLPNNPQYAKLVLDRVSDRFPHNSKWRKMTIAGLSLAAAIGIGAALDRMIGGPTWPPAAPARADLTNIKTRVMIWSDGRAELFVLEDRAGDPYQVFRVIRTEDLTEARLNEIFGRPVIVGALPGT